MHFVINNTAIVNILISNLLLIHIVKLIRESQYWSQNHQISLWITGLNFLGLNFMYYYCVCVCVGVLVS